VNGATVRSAVPFDSNVALNTVRLFTDQLNHDHFLGRAFDAMQISQN
jgi:hypothetical protein